MAKNFNFNAVIKLRTEEFKKGVGALRKSINSIKSSFLNLAGALGVGLGFGKVISEIKDTATKLSVAKATLENVSEGSREYADNLKFLKKASNEYGQSLLEMTQSYAQFRAAAKSSTMSLDEQRYVFESLVRANGAFHLSASQSHDAMIAVTQMMSKGKVTAEELRRQLGNNLPGAFNMMTKAAYMAGVITKDSTSEMESAMKAGKVASSEVLPYFANVLNDITRYSNFDSLQSSLNRFKNSWVDLVDRMNASGVFKRIIDTLSKGFDNMANNLGNIKSGIIAIGATIAGSKIFASMINVWKNLNKSADQYFINLFNQAGKIEKRLDKIVKKSKFPAVQNGRGGISNPSTINGAINDISVNGPDLAKEISQVNHEFMNLYETNKKLGKNSWVKAHRTEYNIIKKQTAEIDKALFACGETQEEAFRWTTKWQRGLGYVKNLAKGIASSLALNGIIAAISIVIGLITNAVAKAVEYRKEMERINKQYDVYEEGSKRIDKSVAEQEGQLKACLEIIRTQNKESKAYKSALDKINKTLGLPKKDLLTISSTYDEILKKVNKWLELQTKLAQVTYQSNKYAEAVDKIDEIKSGERYNELNSRNLIYGYSGTRGKGKRLTKDERREYDKYVAEIKQQVRIREAAQAKLTELGVDISNMGGFEGNNNSEDYDTPKATKTLQGEIDKYKEKLKELDNQKANGAITAEEWVKELEKEQIEAYKAIAAYDNLDEELKKLGADYQNAVSELRGDIGVSKIINDSLKEISEQIDEDLKNLEKEIDEVSDRQGKEMEALSKGIPQPKPVDTFFDYKKSDTEQFSDKADNLDDWIKELENYRDILLDIKKEYGGLGSEAQAALTKVLALLGQAKDEASDMKDKAKISEWIEDVKALENEYEEGLSNAIEKSSSAVGDFASSIHRVAEAVATLSDSELSDESQEFFNKIDAAVGIMDTLVQSINTVTTVIEGLNKISQASEAIRSANSKQELIDMALKLDLLKKEQAEELKSAMVQKAAEKSKAAESKKSALAMFLEMIMGAGSSQAGIPILGPILAIAMMGAVAAAAVAASQQKFAKGGIIGGNSPVGDNNVVRANSGEMVLTKGQQGTLFSMLNGKGGIGGNVQFKIRGADLIGVINNENSRRRG